MSPRIALRPPSSTPGSSDGQSSVTPPKLSWIEGTWNVTHSTLPMWKKNKNVKIAYTRVPNTSPAHIDDVVTYQPLDSSTIKTVHGVDKPFDVPGVSAQEAQSEEAASLGYHWRGKGWLMIASSQWEILGHGDEGESGANQWVVTHFAKTLFTPEGLDIYSRQGHLKEETVEDIKTALKRLGGHVATLATAVVAITTDASVVSG